jgi:hypothetical protein
MANLYTWLKFIHVLGVGTFLFVHGVSGGASFLLRGPVASSTRPLLRASQIAGQASYPVLLIVLITGVWMTFAGHWASSVWPWAALVVLIVALGAMGFVARPYYLARDAAKGPDDQLATRLAAAKPELAAAIGVVALVILFALMVFKPF